MPNHITSCLTITHKSPAKMKWLESCFTPAPTGKDQNKNARCLDFEKIIKPPKNLFRGDLGMDKEKELIAAGIPNWYTWNCANWGTKWNSYQGVLHRATKKSIACEFQTAWAPPQPIFDALIAKGFEINGIWKDEGSDTINEIGDGRDSGDWYVSVSLEFAGSTEDEE